jgi:hypothetical protein
MAIAIQMKDANYVPKIVLEPVLLNQLYAEMDNVIQMTAKHVIIAVKTAEDVKLIAETESVIPGKTVKLVQMIVVFVLL